MNQSRWAIRQMKLEMAPFVPAYSVHAKARRPKASECQEENGGRDDIRYQCRRDKNGLNWFTKNIIGEA